MNGRAIEITAAASAALGVAAVVTGSSWAAMGAGLTAVAAAGLVFRRSPVTEADDATPEATADPAAHPTQPRLLPPAMLAPTFEARVAGARRALRPVSLVLLDLTIESAAGSRRLGREVIARAADATLREADVVGRAADGTFVLILEDTGEDGAVWTAERLRRHVLESVSPARFFAGVATYPNHGLDADEVHQKAQAALAGAREWRQDRIEVASTAGGS